MKMETSTWSHPSLVIIAVLFMLTNSCKKDTTPSTSGYAEKLAIAIGISSEAMNRTIAHKLK